MIEDSPEPKSPIQKLEEFVRGSDFADLVRRYGRSMGLTSEEAEDAAQETICVMISRYIGKEVIENEYRLAARIFRWVALRIVEKRRSNRQVYITDETFWTSLSSPSEEAAIENEESINVGLAISTLPLEDQMLWFYRELNLTFARLSKTRGKPQATLCDQRCKIEKRLKRLMNSPQELPVRSVSANLDSFWGEAWRELKARKTFVSADGRRHLSAHGDGPWPLDCNRVLLRVRVDDRGRRDLLWFTSQAIFAPYARSESKLAWVLSRTPEYDIPKNVSAEVDETRYFQDLGIMGIEEVTTVIVPPHSAESHHDSQRENRDLEQR